jgi:hypothetical protein
VRRLAWTLTLLLLVRAAPAAAPDGPRDYLLDEPGLSTLTARQAAARPGRFAFPPGERLVYAVRYLGVPIGHVWLEVARWIERDGRRLAHLVAGAETNDFWSAIYPIRDVSEAWVDVDRLITVRTRTHTRHGRTREVWEQVDFDWATHYVHIHEEKRHRDRLRRIAFDFGPFVHDTFDLFYALRALPLEPGFAARLPVYANRKVYAFHVDVVRRERTDTDLFGEVPALVLQPYDVLDGKPAGGGEGEVWVREGPRRVPLRVVGWFRTTDHFRVGGVVAELVDYRERTAGWPEPPTPRHEPRPWPEPTEDGRPRWEPPEAVRAARRAAGVEPLDRKWSLSETSLAPPGSGEAG